VSVGVVESCGESRAGGRRSSVCARPRRRIDASAVTQTFLGRATKKRGQAIRSSNFRGGSHYEPRDRNAPRDMFVGSCRDGEVTRAK
jgi:hypothetical protein